MRENVFPQLLQFHPDLIFLSFGIPRFPFSLVGFDGHANDRINNGFGGLTEFDFAWATTEIVGIANEVCEGRVISVVEGGYNVLGGCSSPFALSVRSHVEALSGNFYGKGDAERWAKEVGDKRVGVRNRVKQRERCWRRG